MRLTINRAPVLTLWAAVVAERLGYEPEAALTLGKAVAGLNAQSKGRSLGIYAAGEEPAGGKKGEKKRPPSAGPRVVELMGRLVPVIDTPDGLRAISKERPESPDSVERYLAGKFGEELGAARQAMTALARSMPPQALASRAFELYEAFRPRIPAGTKGWGAKGVLDLEVVRGLASKGRGRS